MFRNRDRLVRVFVIFIVVSVILALVLPFLSTVL